MTETQDLTVIDEALAVIDKGLAELGQRSLMSSDEVANLLLDVRTLLRTSDLPTDEPVALAT